MMLRIIFLLLALGLAGCGPGATPVSTATAVKTNTPADPRIAAYAEATQIVAQAEATAVILAARGTAQARIQQAGATAQPGGATQATQNAAQLPSPTGEPPAANAQPTGAPAPQPTPFGPVFTPLAVNGAVKIIGLGFAADGIMISIQFLAPPQIVSTWFQGNVSLTDEATGLVYNEIPVTGTIGPLFGRPKIDGQPGYVMLVNAPVPLRPGATVTVVLGEYRFEHLVVSGS